MILTPSLVGYPIIPVILELMLPRVWPMGVINPIGSPTAILVVGEIFFVFLTAMLLAGTVCIIIVISIRTAIRITPRLMIFPILFVMKTFLASPLLKRFEQRPHSGPSTESICVDAGRSAIQSQGQGQGHDVDDCFHFDVKFLCR
jgi:hypothetical protein